MPWCPKCKSEYKEGINECVDCKIPLVAVYNEEVFDHYKEIEEYNEMMKLSKSYGDKIDELELEEEEPVKVSTYVDKKTKAEDFKSSAYTLILVGTLGIIALVLMAMGVFPYKISGNGKYVTYPVMGGLFLIFIISGIRSFFTYSKYEKESVEEELNTKTILDFAKENITKEKIVEMAGINENIPNEMKYFKYSEIIKKLIIQEFGEQDMSFLESICDEIYGKIFEE